MELWNMYLGYHPEILDRLDKLDKRTKDRFTRKMKNEKDENNFSSILTELSFFETFIEKGFSVELEKEYVNLQGKKFTPDLTLSKNGQSIIAEVVRLNPTKQDDIRNKFESALIEKLEKIEFGCWLQVDFVQEYFATENYDVEEIVRQVSGWILKNDIVNAQLTVENNFTFKINRIDKKLSHVCVLGNANMIDIDTRRLNSLGSSFVKKISKYSEFLNDLEIPYLVCIKIDSLAGIDKDEMFWTMYGDLVFYQHLNFYESRLNGIYYSNKDAMKYVSGVVLMIGNRIHYYHNYGQHKMTESIKKELMSHQYFGEVIKTLVYLRAK
jgi:hypothetical protein